MKIHHVLCLGVLYCASVSAQPVFSRSSLPSQVSNYVRAYYSTNNPNVASLLTLTNISGLPLPPGATNAVWDFSQAEHPYETVLRTDIVPVDDGGYDSGQFPNAAYAERDTLEPASQIAWRYYGSTNAGRLYYGFYDPPNQNADSLVVFDQPTADIPATVQYGQTWNRSVTWHGLVLGDPIYYYFSASATVDAYGTLNLPGLGSIPALRIHETHAYEADWQSSPVDIHTNQYYYWLVPGLGVAAQIFEFGDNVLYPLGLPNTNTIERVFYANYYPPPPPPAPTNWVRLHLQAGLARLDWLHVSNASAYRVDYAASLVSTNWQTLSLTTNTNYSDVLTTTQRFYRVVPQP